MGTELITQKISTTFFEVRDATLVTWLGMAGALINARGTIILVDPLISVSMADGQQVSESGFRQKVPVPIEASAVPRADMVAYTHADDDHIGLVTAKTLADRSSCRFLAPPPVQRRLKEAGIAEDRIDIARDFMSMRLGSVEITVTPALHDWQAENPWQRGDCCGYLFKTPDGTIWHPGDSRLIDELLDVKGVDVLFFDVAAVNAHLGPEGSARLAVSSGAKIMIAYHYGTFDLPPGSFGSFDPQDSLPYVKDVPARFLQLNPGEVLQLPVDRT
jgi:L-ascorbate metabolism protein UlaG (beta-lactamase superfamily)